MDTDDSLGDIIGDEYLNKEDVTDINNIDNISSKYQDTVLRYSFCPKAKMTTNKVDFTNGFDLNQ